MGSIATTALYLTEDAVRSRIKAHATNGGKAVTSGSAVEAHLRGNESKNTGSNTL